MPRFLVLVCLLALAALAAPARIAIQAPPKPCARNLCYEHYKNKMRGFLNGTLQG